VTRWLLVVGKTLQDSEELSPCLQRGVGFGLLLPSSPLLVAGVINAIASGDDAPIVTEAEEHPTKPSTLGGYKSLPNQPHLLATALLVLLILERPGDKRGPHCRER
jgi:hypothetical protein